MINKTLLIILAFWATCHVDVHSQNHTRMIVTTDIGGSDPDDIQSFVHLMVMLNDVDLEEVSFHNTLGHPTEREPLK